MSLLKNQHYKDVNVFQDCHGTCRRFTNIYKINFPLAVMNYGFQCLKFLQFSGYTGKILNDPRVLTDVGDVPIQEIRDSGVDDDRLMNIISESVKLVMEEVRLRTLLFVLRV